LSLILGKRAKETIKFNQQNHFNEQNKWRKQGGNSDSVKLYEKKGKTLLIIFELL
jgi:hypothetical protein